jgi:hypothetical protein
MVLIQGSQYVKVHYLPRLPSHNTINSFLCSQTWLTTTDRVQKIMSVSDKLNKIYGKFYSSPKHIRPMSKGHFRLKIISGISFRSMTWCFHTQHIQSTMQLYHFYFSFSQYVSAANGHHQLTHRSNTRTPKLLKKMNRGIWTILFRKVEDAPNKDVNYTILRNVKIKIKLESKWN